MPHQPTQGFPGVFAFQDLNALLDKNKTLEEESRNLKETIAMQEEKYEKIQVDYVFNIFLLLII